MTSVDNQLFSVEEALTRLGENKEQGCLISTMGSELVTIYVQNGYILKATSTLKTGREAVELAIHMSGASYHWTRGIKPPDSKDNLHLSIQEFVMTSGVIHKDKIAETGKINLKPTDKGGETDYRYFLVPEGQPTVKHLLTKTATVLGRDKSSDLVIDDFNVSSRHCILDIQVRGLFILDLDSTNGTYVNGVFVKDGYVNPGDAIELGSYRLTLNRESRKPTSS